MKRLLPVVMLCLVVPLAQAQDQPSPEPDTDPAPAAEGAGTPSPGGRDGARGRNANNNEPKRYEEVITDEAETSSGVFTVHKIKDKYYYEIPASELGKDFLFVNQIASNTIGAGYGGQSIGELVVRWERRQNQILLRKVNYDITADPDSAIAKAVAAANTPAILMVFNIETFGKDEAPLIEVTRLFSTEVPEMSARNALRARGMDQRRSFVDKITPFPENIEVEATQTFTTPINPPGQGGRGGNNRNQASMRPGSGTVTVHFSMVKLPEEPMMPRLADARVGYFTTSTTDYSLPEHYVDRRRFIARWRLEKKDPSAEVSEPVKPIVYYIDPATPEKWVPYLKKGIESWQPAFEAAGFRNAIVAKDAPSPAEDPDWSPEDARYSVIRWLPSTTQNASGPHISDPRTGEILDADIQFYQNVMQLVRDWYFVQVGPLDERAATLPLPDELMGELLSYVTAHEVGHTLGLQHNMKASAEYPVDKLRDPEWLAKMSHTPTIMDYSRFNYVAQPEDHVDPALLIPHQGPYDLFSIHWGYAPVEGASSPDDEKETLNAWAKEQDETPWLRFSTDGSGDADAGENTEAVGDADAVYSTTLGLKNLERVMDRLLAATTHEGEDWDELESVYSRALGQWSTELNHVSAIVGGVESQQKHGGQDGVRFLPIERDRQKEAVAFLNQNAFVTPEMFLDPEILRRIEPSGALARIGTAQLRVLSTLMNGRRFNRLVEQEAIDGEAYGPIEFLEDLRHGLFAELYDSRPQVDAFRRSLQRSYLELIDGRLNGNNGATDDQRPMLRGELETIAADAARALPMAQDRETRLHLADLRDQVAKILDPEFQRSRPAGPAVTGNNTSLESEADGEFCWPDYAVTIQ